MTTNQSPTYREIDRSIRGFLKDFEQENTLLPESFAGQVQRLARVYTAVKPLLTWVAVLFLPPGWRKAYDLFIGLVEAVAAGADGVPAHFKAGKDL